MNKPIWERLRTEIDRAGRMAQGAIDEGKTRLDAYRSRQLADKAAQALGYAVYRARKENRELEADVYARLSSTLAAHEAEAERLEAELREAQGSRREEWAAAGAETKADQSANPSDAPPASGSQGPSAGSGDSDSTPINPS